MMQRRWNPLAWLLVMAVFGLSAGIDAAADEPAPSETADAAAESASAEPNEAATPE